MLKNTLIAGWLLAALTVSARAQPSAPVNAPPPARSVRLSIAIKSGADVRTHELVISERGCGNVKEKAPNYEDDVRICSSQTAAGLVFDIEGMTRTGQTEYRQHAEVVVARKGASIEIGRTGGMRFAVKTL